MVNQREQAVLQKTELEGYITIRGGAPDFLFVKVENGVITGFKFKEVKSPSDRLTYNQEIWRKVLQILGATYEVEVV